MFCNIQGWHISIRVEILVLGTYAPKFVCELKPNKTEVHRTRLTVGGDKVHYPGDVGTPTADFTLVKMHVNSVIATQQARYMTLDLKNFYLKRP